MLLLDSKIYLPTPQFTAGFIYNDMPVAGDGGHEIPRWEWEELLQFCLQQDLHLQENGARVVTHAGSSSVVYLCRKANGLTGHILSPRVEQSKKSLKPGHHEVSKTWILMVYVLVLFA